MGKWTQSIRNWELRNPGKWHSPTRLSMNPFRNAAVDTIRIVSLEVSRGFDLNSRVLSL